MSATSATSATGKRSRAATPLWHVDHRHPQSKKYEVGRGRKQKGAHPPPLQELVGEAGIAAVSHEFYEQHTLDHCTLPVEDDPEEPGAYRLDMRRATAARGDAATLGAVTVYRHGLCQSVDLAVKLAGLPDSMLCRGDWDSVDLAGMEGTLVPLFSPVGVRSPMTDSHRRKFAPLTGGEEDARHAFALQPTLLVAMTDTKRSDATADMMAVGFIVSPRCFNHMADGDDGLDVWFGDNVHPGYQATAYYFLVVKSLGKLPLKMGDANPLDSELWQWRRWKELCPDVPPRTGLADVTMHGGAISRAVLPRPIASVAADLASWREHGDLERQLFSAARQPRPGQEDKKSALHVLEGLDARKALLVEHVLRDSPMAYLLQRDGVPGHELLAWRVRLPHGTPAGKALCDEMRRWTADPDFSTWF